MLATLAHTTDPESLEPQDCAALIVLQTADTGPATIDEMQAAARQMTHGDWAPTTAVLESCIRRLLRDGLLAFVPATGTDLPGGFETTEPGRIAINQLLLRPIPRSHGNFTRLCMSMKLCLFHCLDASQRRSQLPNCRRCMSRRWSRCGGGGHDKAGRDHSTDYWLCHEIERLESELAWLGGLETWFAGRHAAE